MKELATFLVSSLVSNPDDVEVEEFEEGGQEIIEVAVAAEELPKVIGKGGETVRALRLVVNAAAYKQKRRARLEIVEFEEDEDDAEASGDEP